MIGRVGLYQAQQHQPRGDALGNHRGYKQEVQGPLGVPHSPQDSRAKVVEHAGGHANEIDAHVQAGLVQHLFGGAHQLQHGRRQGDADNQHNAAKNQAGQHRGVHRLPQGLGIAGAVILGHQHVCAHGKTDEQVDDQVDKGAGRAHRRQGLGPHELPHHDDVRRVEQQLQNAGNRQGDGEPDDLPQQRAMGHVNFIGATAALQFR